MELDAALYIVAFLAFVHLITILIKKVILIPKIKGDNLAIFKQKVEERYKEILKNGDKKEIEKIKYIKQCVKSFPNGFLSELLTVDNKNGTNQAINIFNFLGYDLGKEEDYDFF